MFQLRKTARLVAALALTGALALPSFAQGKMMDSKMSSSKMSSSKMSGSKMSSSKMSGSKMSSSKMSSGKMSSGKMMMSDKALCQMCKMTPAETKTYMSMSKAEKALFRNHMDKMGMSHGKM